jgi:hypothetical protein
MTVATMRAAAAEHGFILGGWLLKGAIWVKF